MFSAYIESRECLFIQYVLNAAAAAAAFYLFIIYRTSWKAYAISFVFLMVSYNL